MKKNFKNIQFNLEEKTFTINKGTVGTYSYLDIINCKVLNENAKDVKLNEEASTITKVAKGLASNIGNFPTDIFVEVQLEMKDKTILKVILSDQELSINTLDFHKDRQEAKDIVAFVKKIIAKYNEENM